MKSSFDGLLPGEFYEGHGWREGTWRIPIGMNDMNIEDPGKHVALPLVSTLMDDVLMVGRLIWSIVITLLI